MTDWKTEQVPSGSLRNQVEELRLFFGGEEAPQVIMKANPTPQG